MSCYNSLHGRLDGVFVGQFDVLKFHPMSQGGFLGDDSRGVFLIPSEDAGHSALRGKGPDDALADTAGSAGNNDNFVVECEIHWFAGWQPGPTGSKYL
jgi:hypothetical protein